MLIDVIFAILVLLACFKGYRKGFIVALFSAIAIFIGIAAALKLSAVVAGEFAGNEGTSSKWLPFVSFMIVFLIVVIVVNLGARIIQKSFEMVLLGWVNRICGMILYAVLYCLLYSILLFYADKLHFLKTRTIESSIVYPYVKPLGPCIINGLGMVIPVFRDIFVQLENFFSSISNKMPH